MLNSMNVNKLSKLEKEALERLSQNQIFLLMKQVTKETLEDLSSEDKREQFYNLREYFFNKDIYSAYNSLYGMFLSADTQRVSLSFEKELLEENKRLSLIDSLAYEFSSNFHLLKMVLLIVYSESDSPNTVKRLNHLIESIYINTWIVYEDCKTLIKIYKEYTEPILENHKERKKFLKEHEEIKVKKEILDSFETLYNILFENVERYEKELKEFETLKEDGFIFLKERDKPIQKDNLSYDFEVFDIVRR